MSGKKYSSRVRVPAGHPVPLLHIAPVWITYGVAGAIEKVGIIARTFCDCDIYTIQFALLSMKFLGRRTVKKTLLFPASPATTHGSTVDLIPSADCTIVGNRQLAPAFV